MRGEWGLDGPELPIEFARQSKGGEITPVITEGAPIVRTLWTRPGALGKISPALLGKMRPGRLHDWAHHFTVSHTLAS